MVLHLAIAGYVEWTIATGWRASKDSDLKHPGFGGDRAPLGLDIKGRSSCVQPHIAAM